MIATLKVLGLLFMLLGDPALVRAGQADDPLKAALDLHDAGKVKEALAEYDKVIKAHPKLAEAYFNRGNAHYDLGQNQQALKDYSEAIRLNPKDGEAYFNRANVYRRLKQNLPALNDYGAAIKLNPDDARSYVNRASVHFDAKRYEIAVKDFDGNVSSALALPEKDALRKLRKFPSIGAPYGIVAPAIG